MAAFFQSFILALIALHTACQICGVMHPEDQLQSGLYTLTNYRSGIRQHNYIFSITNYDVISKTFEMAISVQSISNYNPKTGFDFSVSGGKQVLGRRAIVTLFLQEDQAWTTLRLSYFVSSSSDFIIGTYMVSSFISSNAGGDPNSFSISEFYFPRWKLKPKINYDIVTFISGIRTRDSSFTLSIVNDAVDIADGRILVQFLTKSKPSAQFIQFSYIIYQIKHANYTFNSPQSTYEFSGLQRFQSSSYKTEVFRVCSNRNISFVNNCKKTEISQNGRCIACPENSQPNTDQNQCICQKGFKKNDNICTFACPPGSVYDQTKSTCICNNPILNFIGNQCVTRCPNGKIRKNNVCICARDRFYEAGNLCCDERSTFNGSKCICNTGFYGDPTNQCLRCHQTCGSCKGPQSNQCTLCVDISYQLNNGVCTRGQCPVGTYKQQQICKPCEIYCVKCNSSNQCDQCSPGFDLIEGLVLGARLSYCLSVCGDGRVNDIQQCDDGNKRDGDGCDDKCQIQNGWFCEGSSVLTKSNCQNFIPGRTHIILRDAAQLPGQVIQSVKLSFIPKIFTNNNCVDCFQILKVSIIKSTVLIIPQISYIPNTQGQFSIQFRFQGGETIRGAFTFVLQLNNDLPSLYDNVFSQQDLDQRFQRQINPANLNLASQSQINF